MQPDFVLTATRHDFNIVMEDITELTVSDLCRACSTHTAMIVELVSQGVIEITSTAQSLPQEEWRFTGVHLHRAKVAMRLHRDLGVNFAGAALALQLMDELQDVRIKLNSLTSHHEPHDHAE